MPGLPETTAVCGTITGTATATATATGAQATAACGTIAATATATTADTGARRAGTGRAATMDTETQAATATATTTATGGAQGTGTAMATTTATATQGNEQTKRSHVLEMRNISGHISLPTDKARRPRRHMSKLRSGEMRSMRCYARTRRLCTIGNFQVLRLHPNEAHYMLGLQGTAATCAKEKTTGTHAKEQAKVLHVQASASTHTDMPTSCRI